MTAISPTDRASQLLESPAGTALLMLVVDNDIPIADLANPDIGLHAIAQAVGTISPWDGHGHERIKRTLYAWRDEHRARLDELALTIVSAPDIAWWWEGVDRQHQLWIPQESEGWITPVDLASARDGLSGDWTDPFRHEPTPLLSTSNLYGDISPEQAHIISGMGDWDIWLRYDVVPRRLVRIRDDARILELRSARDWHEFVLRYPADGLRRYRGNVDPRARQYEPDWPWGYAPGLLVPDWRAAAVDWDGVHISPWTFLTAIQVRVESDAGWTQPWSWEGPHTVWLDWVFEDSADLPSVSPPGFEKFSGPTWSLPRLNFSDPRSWTMMPQNVGSMLKAFH